MFRKLHYILFAALMVLSCTSYKNITKEEYDVYNVILEDQVKQVLAEAGHQDQLQIIIQDSTKILQIGKEVRIDSKISQFFKKHMSINCRGDFYFKNIDHYYLNNNFKVTLPNVNITIETITKEKRNGWLSYWQNHPQRLGIVHLSRVGFNFDKKRALVYIGRMWGPLEGFGYEIILRKQKGKWVIINRERVWMS